MRIIYSDQIIEKVISPSIFLAGPTPRSKDVSSWRPTAVGYFKQFGFDGTLFIPERRTWTGVSYMEQVEWERQGIDMCDLLFFWVPRDLETMPAFTTNVEFGRYVTSGKIIYGRPDEAPKNRYLDWLYRLETSDEPINNLKDLVKKSVRRTL